jgi:PAS domain S-box-containing protein
MLTNSTPETDLYRIQVRELRNYAMFTLDTDGNIITWNAGVEEMLGYTEDEWIGQHASIIFTPADEARELYESEMKKAKESGSATDIRWHRRKDGSELFGNGFLNAVRDESGAVIGYTKVLSDETARKQLQDSLTESNAALEQFAYVASHDLQEPLRTMGSYAQLLSRRYKGAVDPEADEFLGFIVDAAKRMSALVEGLLSYARSATRDDRPSSVALDEDLEAALSLLTQAIEESGGVVTHEALPVVQADRGQMVRLFQNLVSNALKYRHPDRPPQVHITARKVGSEWLISLQDNGIGFDPKYAATIFAPFKRLHSDQEYSGTGVGLAICKRIVEREGGRIWAESRPDEGSTFHFTLPDRPAA